MNRPYRFGRIYAVLNLLGAIFDAWLGASMLLRGYVWVAALSAVLTLIGFGTSVGLWRRRRYGFFLLGLSILCGIAGNIYGWFQPSEYRPLYRVAGNTGFFVAMAIIFSYFYKRRDEFS
jgi:hypothetical protein